MLAYAVQSGLQPFRRGVGTGDEDLDDMRLAGAGRLAQDIAVHRNFSYIGKEQPFPLRLFPEDSNIVLTCLSVLRKEYQAGTVPAPLRDRYALEQDEFVGNLHHDAGAVASPGVGAFGSTVLQVLQHGDGIGYQLVGLVAVQVGDHSHSAGIVLVCRIV